MRAGLILKGPELITLADGMAMNPLYKAIQYSSVWTNDPAGVGHGRGQLDSPQAWSAAVNTPGQWFQVWIVRFMIQFYFALVINRLLLE